MINRNFFHFFCNAGIDSTYNILYASRSIFILVNFGYKNTSLVFSLLPEQLHFVFFSGCCIVFYLMHCILHSGNQACTAFFLYIWGG